MLSVPCEICGELVEYRTKRPKRCRTHQNEVRAKRARERRSWEAYKASLSPEERADVEYVEELDYRIEHDIRLGPIDGRGDIVPNDRWELETASAAKDGDQDLGGTLGASIVGAVQRMNQRSRKKLIKKPGTAEHWLHKNYPGELAEFGPDW